jgi:hypothetical protein
MIVQDIIPDKILFIKFKPIGSGGFRPENKTLTLGIKPPGVVADTPPGPQLTQIYPPGSPEGDFHQLPHRGPDYPGINNILPLGNSWGNRGGKYRGRVYRQRYRFPAYARGGFRFGGP